MVSRNEALNTPNDPVQERLGVLAASVEAVNVAVSGQGLGEIVISGAMAGEQPSQG